MRFNILFGGKAGQGPNLLSEILGKALIKQGHYVFVSRDYQSLIRGGHNFNVLTFSDEPVNSNDSHFDMIIALDKNTINLHKKDLNKKGVIVEGEGKGNMYFAGKVFRSLCLDFNVLEEELKGLKTRFDENMLEAKEGYNEESKVLCEVVYNEKDLRFENGNQGIANGAIKSGLDVYYAYPMTPATGVMDELAKQQIEKNFLVVELESEVSVINTALGSAMTGAKAMVGTSGGGFDLMTEALSMSGIAGIPIVIYLASRPGPSTGVATYTSQGDLELARHSAHGEFPRLILAPGNPKECAELMSQAFYFTQKYKIPAIVLGDKHLAESFFSSDEKSVITSSKKSTSLVRYNSYETDKFGCATEDPEIITKNVKDRKIKGEEIEREAGKFSSVNVYGKESENIIVCWGSTKGAILDSVEDLDVKVLQFLYLDPFPTQIKKDLEEKNIILIENNSTGQLGKLIMEKTGIYIPEKNKILKYDGRPFLADELRIEIKRRLKK